jgi:hypothetical protein
MKEDNYLGPAVSHTVLSIVILCSHFDLPTLFNSFFRDQDIEVLVIGILSRKKRYSSKDILGFHN